MWQWQVKRCCSCRYIRWCWTSCICIKSCKFHFSSINCQSWSFWRILNKQSSFRSNYVFLVSRSCRIYICFCSAYISWNILLWKRRCRILINSYTIRWSNRNSSIVLNISSVYSSDSFNSFSRSCRLNSSVVNTFSSLVNIHTSRIFTRNINCCACMVYCLWTASNSIHTYWVFMKHINSSSIFNKPFIWNSSCSFVIISCRHTNSVFLASHISWTNIDYSTVSCTSSCCACSCRINTNISSTASQINRSIIHSFSSRINSIRFSTSCCNISITEYRSSFIICISIYWICSNWSSQCICSPWWICSKVKFCSSLWIHNITKRISSNSHISSSIINSCFQRICRIICNKYPYCLIITNINCSTCKIYIWMYWSCFWIRWTCSKYSYSIISNVYCPICHLYLVWNSINTIRFLTNIDCSWCKYISICIIRKHTNYRCRCCCICKINRSFIIKFWMYFTWSMTTHSCSCNSSSIHCNAFLPAYSNLTFSIISCNSAFNNHTNSILTCHSNFTIISSICISNTISQIICICSSSIKRIILSINP